MRISYWSSDVCSSDLSVKKRCFEPCFRLIGLLCLKSAGDRVFSVNIRYGRGGHVDETIHIICKHRKSFGEYLVHQSEFGRQGSLFIVVLIRGEVTFCIKMIEAETDHGQKLRSEVYYIRKIHAVGFVLCVPVRTWRGSQHFIH